MVAAGNDRGTLPIFGHCADPFALSVAAINLEATPNTQVGGYLPATTEPFSSVGYSDSVFKIPYLGSNEPDITGPDGGPTSVGDLSADWVSAILRHVSCGPRGCRRCRINDAGEPAARGQPHRALPDIEETALPFGDSPQEMGAGLVSANAAVGAAATSLQPYYTSGRSSRTLVASAALSQNGGDVDTGATVEFQVTMNTGVSITDRTPSAGAQRQCLGHLQCRHIEPLGRNPDLRLHRRLRDVVTNLAVVGVDLGGATITDVNGDAADFSGLFNVPSGVSVNSPLVVTGCHRLAKRRGPAGTNH